MNRKIRTALLTSGAALSLVLATATPEAIAKDGGGLAGIDAAATAQALAQKPLHDLAASIDEQGRKTAFSDTYSNIYVDQTRDQVIVYTTDPKHGTAIAAAAKTAHAGVDTSKVKYVSAKYTKKQIDASLDKIMGANKPAKGAKPEIYSAAEAPDGSGIQIQAAPSAVDHVKALLAGNDIPVTVTAGQAQATLDTWRWNDNAPFIGGDVLIGQSHKAGYTANCTAGLAAEDNAGNDYLITADHCFATSSSTSVYGEGDAVGSWGYSHGNFIGIVTADNPGWDAQTIATSGASGSGTNSDEADTPNGQWYAVPSDAYSYNGEQVCQDGAVSYYNGHGVPCGIKVINQDIRWAVTWNDGTNATIRGVEGQSSGYVATEGDSGALVFTVTGSNTRQARGIVSGGFDANTLLWTEAPDILNAFGLHLNPHT
ncbi:hypothetical protein [Kitasatospora viridis]|uniref:Streptogrisin C n=1 Tax=Kitasatospora viridis TaxID=281105 RepID=A0A561SEC7_9ACTN|nr:hypothetical protein [Kitasatospora viridis]TWF73219.1 hypothetical protein FHX73_16370 [Kitasatospora viridis]